jgi:hypothetical protein
VLTRVVLIGNYKKNILLPLSLFVSAKGVASIEATEAKKKDIKK